MHCNNCGTELVENSLFCHKCGNNAVKSADSEEKITNDIEVREKIVSETQTTTSKRRRLTKKKLIILICSLVLVVGIVVLVVCLSSGSSSSSYSSSYDSSSSLENSLESLATSALYNELQQHFSYTNVFNLGATRYSIGTITESGNQWIVRGTFSLYDYYGKITSYYDETFTVKIDKDTYRTTCTTSL